MCTRAISIMLAESKETSEADLVALERVGLLTLSTIQKRRAHAHAKASIPQHL